MVAPGDGGPLDEAALATVPWSKLRHARGQATDLPRMLRALGSPSERARKVARLELDATLWAGPRTFTAGVAAVPFLVDSVLHTPYPDRAATLRLLALLAVGMPDACIASPPTVDRLRVAPKPVRDANAAVTRRVPDLLGLLDDSLPGVRAATGFLLALLPRAGAGVVVRLDAAADHEDDEVTRAALLVACGVARATQGIVDHDLARRGPRSPGPGASVLVRGADAVRRSYGPALGTEDLSTIADLAIGCGPLDPDRFAWSLGEPIRLGITRLVLAGPPARPLAGRLAASLREDMSHADRVVLGGAVLELAFTDLKALRRRVLPADLDAEQVELLAHLAEARAEVDYADFGLPQPSGSWDGARGVRELVEDARRGPVPFDTPLTRPTFDGVRTRPFSAWLADAADDEVPSLLEELAAALEPAQLLDALCAAAEQRRTIRGLWPRHWIPLLPRLGTTVDQARRLLAEKQDQDLAIRQSMVLLLGVVATHTTDPFPAAWEGAGLTTTITLGLGPFRETLLERFPEDVRERLLGRATRKG